MIIFCDNCSMCGTKQIPMKILGRSDDYASGHPVTYFFGCEACKMAKIILVNPRPESVFESIMTKAKD